MLRDFSHVDENTILSSLQGRGARGQMDRTKCMAKICIIALMVVVGVPSSGHADWRDFLPRIYESGADLVINGSYESENNTVTKTGVKWQDVFIREKLMVYTIGYSYDPRFIQFKLSLTGGLKQEDFTANFFEPSSGWKFGTSIEYDAGMFILPSHPYNLQLFAYRIEPLYKVEFGTEPAIVETSRGATFRYKRKPYFLVAKYVTDSLESSAGTSDVTTLSADGAYYKQYANARSLSFSGGYNHTTFSSPSATNGSTDAYQLGNTVDLNWISVSSNVTDTTFSQESTTSPLKTDSFLWQERARARLPLNFTADASYRYTKNTSSNIVSGTPTGGNLSNTGEDIEFSLAHKLYQSLDSSYLFQHTSTTSPSFGSSTTTAHTLTFNYIKAIPWGKLMAGVSLGRSETDNTGLTTVINEGHTAIQVPGSFTLGFQNVDEPTIQVFVKDPVTGALILLDKGVDYNDFQVGNFIQIEIFNLPSPFIVPGTFDFFVSYSLLSADFKIQTDNLAANVSFNLFNDLVTPYFVYTTTRSRLLAGAFPEGETPLSSTAETAGIILHRDPFRVLAEYQRDTSNISPFTAWRGEVDYSQNVTETTLVYARAEYTERSYPRGTSVLAGPSFTERIATASANVLQRLLAKSLVLSAGGTYSYYKSLSTTSAYSLDATLTWRIGKLALNLGANVYGSDTTGTNAQKSHRLHQYYYLNLKRKIL